MPYDLLFLALHLAVAPGWALLIFAPRAQLTRRLVHSGLVPVALGLVYGALLFAGVFLGQAAPEAGMSSLPAVMALFSHPNGVLTGWVHFLIYDLFTGAWIARDAARRGIAHARTLPALVLALVFGPLGLTLWLAQRLLSGAGWDLAEA